MQWIHAAWFNAVEFLQLGPKHPDLMQWILCSMSQYIPIECSGFYAAWPKASRLKSDDSMQRHECSGFHALWLNAVDSMQPGKMHPYWMYFIPCSMIEFSVFQAAWSNGTLLNEVYFMHHDWMHWIPAAWMNAVYFLQHGPSIPIECSGFHAAWLNAVDSMQLGKMHPYWMHWIPCSVI